MRQKPSILHKHISKAIALLLLPTLGISCQQGSHQQPGPGDKSLPIRISTRLEAHATRATDTAFEDGDQVGVYVVDRIDGKQTSLLASGNHADNARFTYHSTWTPDQPLYWLDQDTHADFYLYYPHDPQMGDPRYWSVSVPTDQSTEAAMRQADVLVGRALDASAADQVVSILARHVMSRLTITLQAGKGVTEEELKAARLEVYVNRLVTESRVNIATATVRAYGTVQHDIRACQTEPLTFAITAVPQTVKTGTLITIVVNGDRYTLRNAITLRQGTSHHATVSLGASDGSLGATIAGWTTDDKDYGGTAQ